MNINGTEVQLIFDLSSYEWDPTKPTLAVNFSTAKAAGIAGAYFRGANGNFPDATAPVFAKSADSVGMPWGLYGIFYPPNTDGYADIKTQAQEFVNTTQALPTPGKLPLGIDWERPGVTWQMVYEYITIVQKAFPQKEIIIYATANFMKDNLPNPISEKASYDWFTKFQVWQAEYGVTTPTDLPSGFTRVLWQYTGNANASLYGINPLEAKGVDMSYFYGSLADFNQRFGI